METAGKKKAIIVGIVIVLVVLASIGGYVYYDYDSRVYKKCEIEAGSQVYASDFLKNESKEIEFENGETVATDVPGEHEVRLKSGIFTYTCLLNVVDSVPPTLELQPCTLGLEDTPKVEDFVVKAEDVTAVTLSFAEGQSFDGFGSMEVTIEAVDTSGNKTVGQTEVFISPVKEAVKIEAGSEVPEFKEFLASEQITNASLITVLEEIDTTKVGAYDVEISFEGEKYCSKLEVQDTIAPVVSAKNLNLYKTSIIKAEDFIDKCEDVTEVKFTFEKEPDLSKESQELTILAIDEGQNQVELKATLTLKEDTEAPVLKGVKDLVVIIGKNVSYKKGVTVTDNCDKDIECNIDTSQVKLNEQGTYEVTYSATDRAGNSVSKTVTVKVVPQEYTEEAIYALADDILAGIINDSMSQYDKIAAIYNWNKSHIGYIGHSEKGNWLRAAYEGMVGRKGDCYVYFATGKALLTRAGIRNVDIQKIPASSMHYWSAVDIGEGWRHFDSCPRADKSFDGFYKTDDYILEYSNSHGRTHNYDKAIYTYFD